MKALKIAALVAAAVWVAFLATAQSAFATQNDFSFTLTDSLIFPLTPPAPVQLNNQSGDGDSEIEGFSGTGSLGFATDIKEIQISAGEYPPFPALPDSFSMTLAQNFSEETTVAGITLAGSNGPIIRFPSDYFDTFNLVPEPATTGLLLLAAGSVGFLRRRRFSRFVI